MKLVRVKLSILVIFLLLPVFCLATEDFPSFPMAFWGNTTVDDKPLSAGTTIKAYCNDSLIGETVMVEEGVYGYTESTRNKLLVSNCSGDILFKYVLVGTTTSLTGGEEIKYSGGFVSGKTVPLNLDFINTRSCNISNGTGKQVWNNNSWGDCSVVSCNAGYHKSDNSCVADSSGKPISGDGNKGGVNTQPAITTGDINGDNKVDKYDFALMMAAWGQTGSNGSDLNEDGKVDKYDFALLMLYWS